MVLGDLLKDCRRREADKAYEAFDYGDSVVVENKSWESTNPGVLWTKQIYSVDKNDQDEETCGEIFVVVFAGVDSSEVIDSYVMA